MSDRASAVFDIPAPEASVVRCAECASRVCDSLRDVPGVHNVDCDGAGASVRVEYDPDRVSESDLEAEVSRFGAELGRGIAHAAWRVTGLD